MEMEAERRRTPFWGTKRYRSLFLRLGADMADPLSGDVERPGFRGYTSAEFFKLFAAT
jgi:hypothetical protein